MAVVAVDVQRPARVPRLIHQARVGWESTCTATAAELKAIELAAVYARRRRRRFAIATDSQESVKLINKKGRSTIAEEAAGAVLRVLGSCKPVLTMGWSLK